MKKKKIEANESKLLREILRCNVKFIIRFFSERVTLYCSGQELSDLSSDWEGGLQPSDLVSVNDVFP